MGSCQPLEHETLWDYNDNLASRIDKPDNCFRMTVDHGLERNYLDAYTVTVDPQLAPMSLGARSPGRPGKISPAGPWTSSPWSRSMSAPCLRRKWNSCRIQRPSRSYSSGRTLGPPPSNVIGNTLAGFQLAFKDASDDRHRFTAMWYLDDTTDAKMDVQDLYQNHNWVDPDADPRVLDADARAMVSGSLIGDTMNMVVGTGGGVWVPTLDKDFDPIYGDLGKVDLGGVDTAENFADADDSNACSADDGGSAKGKDLLNGTLCDAVGVEIETSVTYPLGLGYGCDPVKVAYTLTCDWSARGNRNNEVGGVDGGMDPADGITDGSDLNTNYVSCKVE